MSKKYVNKPEIIQHPYQLTANFIKWKFSPGENRVLIRMLQRIKLNQEQDKNLQIDFNNQVSLRFHWRDLMLPNDNASGRLKVDLTKLREKSIQIPSTIEINGNVEKSLLTTGIITETNWDLNNSYVDIKLNDQWYLFLLDLSKGYTEYNGVVAYKLNSSYTIKMYYFICHWFDKPGITLTIENIRKEFDIPLDKYTIKTASRIKSRILEPAKKNLDKYSDKSFNYTPVKEGRKIIGFSFVFYSTKNDKDNKKVVDWKVVNSFLDEINKEFVLVKEQRARMIGLIKKYTFPIVKYFYKQQKHVIYDHVSSGLTFVDAMDKGLKDYNLDPNQS